MSSDPRHTASAVYRPPTFEAIEHRFELPLDHDEPAAGSIDVFVREVAAPGAGERPSLLFFEGGPGHEGPRPFRWASPAWLTFALEHFRVLFMDQRGTGRSSPIDAAALADRSASEQADYLTHFRADSIVRDAEQIRQALGVERWTVLGESFGGFCVLRYLSAAPDGLEAALITGGLPPVGGCIDDVYRSTYRRVAAKVAAYYRRYPSDEARAHEICEWLESDHVSLPSGDRLLPHRFRQLGCLLGMGDGLDRLHYLLELPRDSAAFLIDVEQTLPFGRNPLYALLHEACWMDGGASRWSAARMLEEEPTFFTGEHIYPWIFEDHQALAGLRQAAELLAQHEWKPLYDEAQLRQNKVPSAAVIYAEDMYVESSFSLETAELVGGMRSWLTNEYEHDGLIVDGGRVLGRLLDLTRGMA